MWVTARTGGGVTEAVRFSPYSVLLLDEILKAFHRETYEPEANHPSEAIKNSTTILLKPRSKIVV